MGATTFFAVAKGATVQDAFRSAIDAARYEYGNRGYTGSISEKDSVVEIHTLAPVTEAKARKIARKLIDERDSRIDSKYGPAGAIRLNHSVRAWLFFGWASC